MFCVHHSRGIARPKLSVLGLRPFAEELNKSRRILVLAATHLAASGAEVLIPDRLGTGDSEGEFNDSNWEIGIENIESAMRCQML